MKHKIIHTLILSLAVCMSSCTDDEIMQPATAPVVDGYYFILAGQNSGSRVSYIDEKTSMFETGDILGAFAPDNAEQPVNVRYAVKAVTQSGKVHQVLTPVSESAELASGLGKYIFYYPYDATTNTERLNSLDFTVRADQRKDEDFEASDILWDVLQPDADAQNAIIDMDHVMATIVVKIDKDSLDVKKGIDLLNVATEAKGVNRLACVELDDMINTNSYTTGEQNGTIKMHPEKFSAQNQTSMRDMLVYRAAVPAFQTLIKGQEILQVDLYNQDGSMSAKKFKLAGDLKLLPGHSYTFTLRSGIKPPVPEVGDDDSWVLEVTDPSDGELVGYLCREYIYWAPAEYATNYRNAPIDGDGSYMFEKKGNLGSDFAGETGYMLVTNPATDEFKQQLNEGRNEHKEFSGMIQGINSQAWVFYNLKANSKVPDLTKGTILRIVYDIKAAGGIGGYTPFLIPKYAQLDQGRNVTLSIWPKPHTSRNSGQGFQGIFKAAHGHDRINTIALYGGETGYAYDSPESLEFYMHGGIITWDSQNNIVDQFFMPEEKITNKIAYDNGHIAIKTENGVKTAHVSYSAMTSLTEDEEGYNVGQLIIKNLDINGHKYPLRKVGFNQFWSGISLRNVTDADGKELECFNTDGEVGAVNYAHWSQTDKDQNYKHGANEVLPPGYIYPTGKKGKTVDGNQMVFEYDRDYDPWKDESLRGSTALLYNRSAFISGKLKPHDTSTETYRHPTWGDMIALRRYGGFMFAAKWITDKIRTKQADESYVEGTTEALERGLLLGNRAYCANISGLDFRAYGLKWPAYDNNGEVDDLGLTTYFYIDGENSNPFKTEYNSDPKKWVEIFKFSAPDCWGSNPMNYYRHTAHTSFWNEEMLECTNSRIFAPVRVIMSFKDPIGNGAREAVAAHSRASFMQTQPTRSESRNVYVPLTE